MAEIKSFPNNQDVYIGAEWVMKWLHGRTSGVFGAENNLSTSVVPDSMSVEVSDGVGWLSNANGDGIVFWNDSEQSNGSKLRLTHDVADGVLDRIDRIVVTWETTNYVALPTISILKGIASSNPKPPELTNNNTQRQISLRQQRIPAGAISISSAFGTDERLNSDVCGIVTESVLVDTSVASAQFNELLQLIENNLKQIVANQIADKSVTNEKLADGAVTVQKLSKEVKEFVSADNLLDNSDFTNPVNQRGSTNYVDLGYTIDRWTSVNYGNTVTVADGYIHLKTTEGGSWRQYIEKDNRYIGKKMTIAAKLLDGSIVCASGTVPNTSDDAEIVTYKGPDYEVSLNQLSGNLLMQFSVFASEISIKWAALYEGEYTAETLPVYQPKGYGTELLECRRYYQELNYNALGNGYTISGGGAAVLIVNTGIQMRIVPTLVGEKNITVRADGTDYSAQFNTISMYEHGNGAVCEIVVSGTIPAKQPAAFFATGKVALSADL